MQPDAITRVALLIVLTLTAGNAGAGFWQRLDAFFSAPPLDTAYQEIVAKEGWSYLLQKDDVFQADRPVHEPEAAAPPVVEELRDSSLLVDVLGFQDVEVTALVDYDNGLGYTYAAGDPLVIRLYTAALVRQDPDGVVEASRASVVALRNMSNPANREGEVGLVTELQKSSPFTDEERARLAGEVADPRIP